eukprot:TRINITY_DN22021_c0_g1_i1.p3 TRINITY_DN22021_c0_g1~~TRINITY_DN22021_c0_g1_i1.p3  ORF type:complete len:127 (-),score=33.79 TRINITY_DN22021_c0_g1_i1:159-518(-)
MCIRDRVIRVCIHEGFNHQVKRMIGACGGAVAQLHREAVGPVSLEHFSLAPGEAIELSDEVLVDMARGLDRSTRGNAAREEWEVQAKREHGLTQGSERRLKQRAVSVADGVSGAAPEGG